MAPSREFKRVRQRAESPNLPLRHHDLLDGKRLKFRRGRPRSLSPPRFYRREAFVTDNDEDVDNNDKQWNTVELQEKSKRTTTYGYNRCR